MPNVGVNFTVNVNISDVTDLYGYELEMYYNSNLLNGTQVTEGSFLKSGGSTFFWVLNFIDNYNATHGVIRVLCALSGADFGVNGSGVLAVINFRSMATGGPSPLTLADTRLYNFNSDPIAHVSVSNTVTVIPEFPLGPIQLPLMLLIIAALVVFAKKRAVKPQKTP